MLPFLNYLFQMTIPSSRSTNELSQTIQALINYQLQFRLSKSAFTKLISHSLNDELIPLKDTGGQYGEVVWSFFFLISFKNNGK